MTREDEETTRRAVLGGLASAGLIGAAGCAGSASSPSTTTKRTTQQTTSRTTTNTTTTSQPADVADTEVLSDFEDLSRWSVETGSMEADSSMTYSGSQSARLTHENGTVRITRDVDMDMSSENLSLAFRMESSGNAVVQVGLHAPDAENKLTLGEGVRQESSGNWFRLDVGARDVAGLPELESVKKVEVRVRGGGPDTKFWVDDLRRVPSPEDGYAVLFFDDGLESAYTEAYSVLQERDMPATIPVITDRVGDEGYVTMDQLDEVASNGWNVCSHTSTHENLENISRLTAEREIVNAKQWLVDHGFETGARWLVYPYGGFSEAVTDFARDHHDLAFRYMGTRSVGSGRITQEMTASRGDASDIDIAKRMVDLGDLYSDIEMFTFHDVGTGGEGLGVTRSQFEEFVNYLQDSSLKVVTPETVYSDLRAKAPDDE